MAALFSNKSDRPTRKPREEQHSQAAGFLDDEPAPSRERYSSYEFDAELDVCELDERDRPGLTWPAQALDLSRSHLGFRSRRMCYINRRLLIAVHLIDDRPVALAGTVVDCNYDSEALYRVVLELSRVPHSPDITAWLQHRRPR